jgi:hypothetical protein
MNSHRSAIGLSMAALLLACAAPAHARVSSTEAVPSVASSAPVPAPVGPAVPHRPGQQQIAEATRCLEQATLQWDFASNADVLALLRKAQDDLVTAARQLHGRDRMQADELLADLNHAIEQSSTRSGRLASPSGETYGPQAPNRNELAELTTQAQDLERGVPFAHRLLVTLDPDSTDQRALPAHTEIQQADFALARADLQSWPPEPRVRWPQVHFRF